MMRMKGVKLTPDSQWQRLSHEDMRDHIFPPVKERRIGFPPTPFTLSFHAFSSFLSARPVVRFVELISFLLTQKKRRM